jgi:hypothetical protein
VVILCQKTKCQPTTDILRIPEIYHKYRYANISQQFKGPKNLLLVGDIAGFINLKKHSKHNKFRVAGHLLATAVCEPGGF